MCKFLRMMALTLSLVVSVVCLNTIGVKAADERPQGWTDETHGKKAPLNYSLLFPDNKVNRIDIVIDAATYSTMDNEVRNFNMMNPQDPSYVPVTVKFNNLTWWNVGMRYKGQSTLSAPIQAGNHKYPFRLNFDKFEDDHPEINNQRIYGFDELIFSNNWYDASFIRDKVTGDIFRSAGIPTPRSAFYRVYIDSGKGPTYWGLYTTFEDPSDTMIKSQFSNPDGNMYKGQSGTGADLTTFNQQGYEKKTNEDANDWSDLQSLVSALNASRSNPATWRANLESVFDVNLFLKWLAINTSIINFDTYGWVTKNHYIYQDLSNNGRMVYLPWDFNLSLSSDPFGMMGMGGMGGFGGFGGFGGVSIPASLSLDEIGNSWPLIRFLMSDPVYKNIYHNEMKNAQANVWNETTINSKITQLSDMIRPYTVGAEGEINGYRFLTNGQTQFNQAVTEVKTHISTRQREVSSYLSTVNISPIPSSTPKISPIPTPTQGVSNKGDINGDGTVNSTDYAALRRHILGITILSGNQLNNADVNNDGAVNSTDYALIRRRILGIINAF